MVTSVIIMLRYLYYKLTVVNLLTQKCTFTKVESFIDKIFVFLVFNSLTQ